MQAKKLWQKRDNRALSRDIAKHVAATYDLKMCIAKRSAKNLENNAEKLMHPFNAYLLWSKPVYTAC